MGKIKTFNKGTALELEPDDLTALTELAVSSLKRHGGKPCKYANTEAGLDLFMQKSQGFFEYCNEVNASLEPQQRLIPDIEGLCCYLGITRTTLFDYSRRNQAWTDAIEMVKNAILMAKKQLAMRNRIPQMIAVFDWANNHDYRNTSEFHLVAEKPQEETAPAISTVEISAAIENRSTADLPQLPD